MKKTSRLFAMLKRITLIAKFTGLSHVSLLEALSVVMHTGP